MKRGPEEGVALGSLVALIALHVASLVHAGALWRDEVTSVNLASMSPQDFMANLQFDSFPIVWYAVLRVWAVLGLGSTDLGLRVLGLLLGLGVLAALGWNARRFGASAPLFSFALVGFNAATISYGDSVRGYGLGILTGLVAFGLVWEVVERPTLRTVGAAAAAGLLSVHCLFYNTIILLAACAGGAAVAARRRQWRTIALQVGVGLPAALSLALYRGTIRRANDWNAIVKWPIDLPWIWTKFLEATRLTGRATPWLWAALALGSVGVAAFLVARPGHDVPQRPRDAALFCVTALVVGVTAYVAFLLELSYIMEPWYFLSLMGLVGSCLDGILLPTPAGAPIRALRAAVAGLIIAVATPGVLSGVRVRKTNVDLVAAKLTAAAVRGDLIVVIPWQCGITFDRYYHGSASWTTVPPIDSRKVHRYDLLKQAMMSPGVMQPLLERMMTTLRGGHRVFWVGHLRLPPPAQDPPTLAPAPQGLRRWREDPHEDSYYEGWRFQAGVVFRDHAVRIEGLAVAVAQPVSVYENLPVAVIEGWRNPARVPE